MNENSRKKTNCRAENSSFIIYPFFFFASTLRASLSVRFICLSASRTLYTITVLCCTSGLSRALNMYVSGHAKRARISKETFSSRCNPVPVEFRMHPGCCYLSIQQLVAWVISSRVESSSNDSIVLTHKSTFIRTVTIRGRRTFYVRTRFTSDAARYARI